MQGSKKTLPRRALEIAIAFTPWVISMYTLFWLEHSEVWTTETAHRGKISVSILVVGMLASFLIHSRLSKNDRA